MLEKEKTFTGAPFGSQSNRFNTSGIHPKFRGPGCVDIDNNLGPGFYSNDNNNFVKSSLEKSDWKRKLALERFSQMPYILNKDMYNEKEEQKRKLGPGYYVIPEPHLSCTKNIKGIMSQREKRFKDLFKDEMPGPGNYGKSGIPHLLKEENDNLRKSPSKIGFLNNGGTGERSLPLQGCDLSPSTYNIESSIQNLLKRQMGKRGYYDIFSLNRTKPIKTGHLAYNPAHNLAPNHYEIKTTNDLLDDPIKQNHGKFFKMKQYPDKPHDKAYWEKPGRVIDINNQLSPVTYNPKLPCCTRNRENLPPFNSSSERSDKLSNMFFTGNYNSVGPGRYNLQLSSDVQYVNSHENLFRSKTSASISPEKKIIMNERLKEKNIPHHCKNFIDHIPTEASPSVDCCKLVSLRQAPIKIC